MEPSSGTRLAATWLALVGGALAACQPEAPSVEAASPEVSAAAREDREFESQHELLDAIEKGTFAERAGIEEEVEAALVPPEPVVVEFVSGTQVPADQGEELRELAALLTADERLGVDLVGCSDPSGPAALNLRISQSRADSVAARLRELGVAEAQLGEVVGRGEDCEVQERAVRITPSVRDAESS